MIHERPPQNAQQSENTAVIAVTITGNVLRGWGQRAAESILGVLPAGGGGVLTTSLTGFTV